MATKTTFHKPLPSLPAPEGPLRSTTLSVEARSHRARLIKHFLEDVSGYDVGLDARRDGWLVVIEEVLDELGHKLVRGEWLATVKRGKAAKLQAHGKPAAMATGTTTNATEDKPLPELEPLTVLQKLASRPTLPKEEHRAGHLVLCAAPHRGGDLPTEDSGFDLVAANIGCTFHPGKFFLQRGSVLYGLEGVYNDTLETSIRLVGGTFAFKGLTTAVQHRYLSQILRVAIYIHISLILEQHLLLSSGVQLKYPRPKLTIPSPSTPHSKTNANRDNAADKKAAEVEQTQNTTDKEDTGFAWSNLRKRASMIPSSFNLFARRAFNSRSQTISTPGETRGGSLDLPLYHKPNANGGTAGNEAILAAQSNDVSPNQPSSNVGPSLPASLTTPAISPQSQQLMQQRPEAPPAFHYPLRIHRFSFRATGEGGGGGHSRRSSFRHKLHLGSPPPPAAPTSSDVKLPSTPLNLPFSTALARIESTKDLLSTSPNLSIPLPKLIVDLAAKERQYHDLELEAASAGGRSGIPSLEAHQRDQRQRQTALGIRGKGSQWPWWLKGDERVALSSLLICSSPSGSGPGYDVVAGASTGESSPIHAHPHGHSLKAMLGLLPDVGGKESAGAGGKDSKAKGKGRAFENFTVQQSMSVLWTSHVPSSNNGTTNTTTSGASSGYGLTTNSTKEKESDELGETSSRFTTSSSTTATSGTTTNSSLTNKTTSTSLTTNTNNNTITSSSTSILPPSSIPPSSTCGKPFWKTYQFYSTRSEDPSLETMLYEWINERNRACEQRPSVCAFKRGEHERRVMHAGVRIVIRVGEGEPEAIDEPPKDVPSDLERKVKEVVGDLEEDPKGKEVAEDGQEKSGVETVDQKEEKKEQDEDEVNKIEMYLSCSICGAKSKRKKMDDGTSLISFAKFLELLVYSPQLYILNPTLCEHTPSPVTSPPPPSTSPSSTRYYRHINSTLRRHFFLPPSAARPLDPTGEVTITTSVIDDTIFEICVPRMQILSGLGVDSSGRVNLPSGIINLKNVLGIGGRRSKAIRKPKLEEPSALSHDDDKKDGTKEKDEEDGNAELDEEEQKRTLRREIKKWWEGVADHVDRIEKVLDAQAKILSDGGSKTPSQGKWVYKALPRLPSVDDAYDVFDVPDREPSTTSSTSASKLTSTSVVDPGAMSTVKEIEGEGEGEKTPRATTPTQIVILESEIEVKIEGSSKIDENSPGAEGSESAEVINESEDKPLTLQSPSVISLAPTLPPKDLPAQDLPAQEPSTTTISPPDRKVSEIKDVQEESSAVLLSSLRHNFHELEQNLYSQLAKTPEAKLNDVRRSFLAVGRGTERRLKAWEKKHLKNNGSKKAESEGGPSRNPSRRGTADSVAAGQFSALEPEWWKKGCHVLPGGNVVVREGDWGSIVAHTLSTGDYQSELANISTGRSASFSTPYHSTPPTPLPLNSTPTTPDEPGTSSSGPSSFFSISARYKLFSATRHQPDPDADDPEWHEQEPYSAFVTRKEHYRDPTNTSSGTSSTGATSLSLRDVLRQRPKPRKDSVPISEDVVDNIARGSISRFGTPHTDVKASVEVSTQTPSPNSNTPIVKAKADVQISKAAAPGEMRIDGEAEKILLQELGGATLKTSRASSIKDVSIGKSGFANVHIQKAQAGSVISQASKESEETIGKEQKDEAKGKDGEEVPEMRDNDEGKVQEVVIIDNVSITGLPPPLPPKDSLTNKGEEVVTPSENRVQPSKTPNPPLDASPLPPPPTSSGFASALASGLQHVAMRFMTHSEPPSRVASPTQSQVKKQHDLLGATPSPPAPSLAELAIIDERPHIKYDWTVGKRLKFSCTVYYAKQFDLLRKRCGIDEIYIKSLSRSLNWSAEGGKSRSNFWKTNDDRFITKTLVNAWNVADLQVLIELAPSYFRYMESTASRATVLAKLAGFYTIEIRNLETGAVQSKSDVLVMENLFYDRSIGKTFDLKGIQGRKVKAHGPTSKTLFDGEWIEGQQRTLTLVQPYSKAVLRDAVRSDAEFLAKSNIMDYSLLLGLDEERKQIACGLVDTIGSYTFAKTLEYKAKHNLQAGSKEITVIPPNEYQERFVNALDGYFIACPDKWSKPLDDSKVNYDPNLLPSVL